ncbi:hypothetical protein [Moraxella lacunata]
MAITQTCQPHRLSLTLPKWFLNNQPIISLSFLVVGANHIRPFYHS